MTAAFQGCSVGGQVCGGNLLGCQDKQHRPEKWFEEQKFIVSQPWKLDI